jgi:hypothetical protein
MTSDLFCKCLMFQFFAKFMIPQMRIVQCSDAMSCRLKYLWSKDSNIFRILIIVCSFCWQKYYCIFIPSWSRLGQQDRPMLQGMACLLGPGTVALNSGHVFPLNKNSEHVILFIVYGTNYINYWSSMEVENCLQPGKWKWEYDDISRIGRSLAWHF